MAAHTTCNRFAPTFSKLELPWKYHSYYRANFYSGGAAGSQIGLPNHSYSAKSNVLGQSPILPHRVWPHRAVCLTVPGVCP